MKINWNKKYTTYAIYAAIVSAALIFCIFVGVYIKDIWKVILKAADVLSPVVYGVIIAYIASPLVGLFERQVLVKLRNGIVRRLLSVLLTYIVFLAALALLIYAIVPQILKSFNDLQANLALYSQSLQEWLDKVSQESRLMAALVSALNSVIDFSVLSAPISKLIEIISELVAEFSPYIMSFFTSFVVQLKNIIIGLVFSGYLLCSKELVFAQINKLMHVLFKEERIRKFKDNIEYADKTFGKYLMGTFLDAMIVGFVIAIAMLIFRIPYVSLVAVLIACTNIIPIFGPFIGGIPSILIVFIADPIKALWLLVIILIVQQIDGNFIAPRILGSSTGLPALYVIVAITVMGGFFGIVGMIIGVPVFAIIGNMISKKTSEKMAAQGASDDDTSAPITESATTSENPLSEPVTDENAAEVAPEFTDAERAEESKEAEVKKE